MVDDLFTTYLIYSAHLAEHLLLCYLTMSMFCTWHKLRSVFQLPSRALFCYSV